MTDFQPLFIENFRSLKKRYPEIKVGWPGFAYRSSVLPAARLETRHFLQILQKERIKPDFISLRIYPNHPADFYEAVSIFRQMTTEKGFVNIPLHVTE